MDWRGTQKQAGSGGTALRLNRVYAVVGSRAFQNYSFLHKTLQGIVNEGDALVSGGALGVDSMAQRYAKENGLRITIIYPNFARFGPPATFIRNKEIVEESTHVLVFYAKGRFRQGGSANAASWAEKLKVPLREFEEE